MKNLNQVRILIVALSSVLAFFSFCNNSFRKGKVQYQSMTAVTSQLE
jgi:hypothetical protein